MGNGVLDAIRETAAGILDRACDAGTALPRVINGIGAGDPEAALNAVSDGVRAGAGLAGMATGGVSGAAENIGRRIAGEIAGDKAQDWLENKGINFPDLKGHDCLTGAFDAARAREQIPKEYEKFFAPPPPVSAPGLN